MKTSRYICIYNLYTSKFKYMQYQYFTFRIYTSFKVEISDENYILALRYWYAIWYVINFRTNIRVLII